MSDDSLAEIKARLHNWARWSHYGEAPKLSFALSSIWRQWIPTNAFDSGWGNVGAPEEMFQSIDERDADFIGKLLLKLDRLHRRTIVLHYYDREGQRRDRLDEACRALNDLLP